MNKAKNWIFLSLIVILGSACWKQNALKSLEIPEWNPQLAFPLFHADYTVGDLLLDLEVGESISVDSSGLVTLHHKGSFSTLAANDIFPLHGLPFNLNNSPGKAYFGGVPGAGLDEIKLENGKVKCLVKAQVLEDLMIKFNIPGATKGGVPFEKSFILEANGSGLAEKQEEFSLDGYDLTLEPDGSVGLEYSATGENSNAPYLLDEFSGEFFDLFFDFIKGAIGNLDLGDAKIEINYSAFDQWKSGTVFIDDPKFILKVTNSFGIPFGLEVKSFSADGSNGNLNINGTLFQDTLLVNFPNVSNQGELIVDTWSIDPSNSNVGGFVAISPKSVDFNFSLSMNPENSPIKDYFALDSSLLKVELESRVPMTIRMDSIILEDTLGLVIPSQNDISNATIRFDVENELPLELRFQAWLLDSMGVLLDSLVMGENRLLAAAPVNLAGESNGSVTTTFFAGIDAFNSEKFKKARKLRVRIGMLTTGQGQQTVRILDGNRIALNAAMQVGVIIQP